MKGKRRNPATGEWETPEEQRERMAKVRALKVTKGNPEGNLFSPAKWEKRCESFRRRNAQDIQFEQRDLKKLTLRNDISQPSIKKQIRKKLETISLLFAADSTSGDEFRKNVALAVDLSGYKREVNEKIKRQGQKKAERAKAQSDLVDRQRMIEREQKQQAEGPQEF